MEKDKRIGAKSQKDIDPKILSQLNEGVIESANLTEWLSVDHIVLIKNVLPKEYQLICLDKINSSKPQSVMSIIKVIGYSLYMKMSEKENFSLFEELKFHKSDSVRCWCAYIIGYNVELSIVHKLESIKPFASDSHFGVREIAWMAVRDELAENLEIVIPILEEWSVNDDLNIRRFSTESIRPNGVWCKKIDRLRLNPEIALSILENLKTDTSRYVQDSVANWLNDAGKTQPEFVIKTCERWREESDSKETHYIIKRAMRSIKKG